MNADSKRRIAYEIINILGAVALLCLVMRIWPLLFLVIPAIITAALRLLFLSSKEPANKVSAEKAEVKNPPATSRPENEQDVIRIAYGILQRRIADEITARYPAARYVWCEPNPIENFAQDMPLSIILSQAGGFRKAAVQVHNLQFKGLLYETVTSEQTERPPEDGGAPSTPDEEPDPADTEPIDTEPVDKEPADTEPADTESVDYSVLAFEWVNANFLRLNEICNKEIAEKSYAIIIPAESLPLADSWESICKQLVNVGFPNAVIDDDKSGIQIFLPQHKNPSERE